MVVALAAVVLVVVVLLAVVTPGRSTFVDDTGRTCTQVTTVAGVALDCDYPPAESRLGGFLDDLDTP